MKSQAVIDAEERETTNGNGSRFNAVKHGLTAATLVLPGEDPTALQAKIDAYKASLETRNPVEDDLAERAAQAAWRHERALREEIARANREILTKRAADKVRERMEAEARGQRLLFDRRGPIELYPSRDYDKQQERTSWIDDPNDPDHPKQLVLAMEATLSGCAWLASSWRELRDILDLGSGLQSYEKFKMIRLMGRQPINAASVPDFARVFLACHVLEPQFSHAFQELRSEIHEDRFKGHKGKLDRWNKVGIIPADPTAARDVLLAIIDKAIERLRMLEAEHRAFAEQLDRPENGGVSHNDDDKPRGQLDRHLEICDRSIHRNLQGIGKLRRNEAEGWGRTRRERERRAEDGGKGNRDDERLVMDERGTVRPARLYKGNLEEGLARYDALGRSSGLNGPAESRREIEETHVRAVPDFARWTPPVEDLGVGGDGNGSEGDQREDAGGLSGVGQERRGRGNEESEYLLRREGEVEMRNAGSQEGAGRELVTVTQVLTETGGQSNGQNEIVSGQFVLNSQLSVVSCQLLEGGAGGQRDGGDSSGGPDSLGWDCDGAGLSGPHPPRPRLNKAGRGRRWGAGCAMGVQSTGAGDGGAETRVLARVSKRDNKQWRKEMARMELERRKRGMQQIDPTRISS
jgi:hypothetical protein